MKKGKADFDLFSSRIKQETNVNFAQLRLSRLSLTILLTTDKPF